MFGLVHNVAATASEKSSTVIRTVMNTSFSSVYTASGRTAIALSI